MLVDELKELLKENLSIDVEDGGFCDPNSRKVVIKFDGEEISTAYFDVVQTREYEG